MIVQSRCPKLDLMYVRGKLQNIIIDAVYEQ